MAKTHRWRCTVRRRRGVRGSCLISPRSRTEASRCFVHTTKSCIDDISRALHSPPQSSNSFGSPSLVLMSQIFSWTIWALCAVNFVTEPDSVFYVAMVCWNESHLQCRFYHKWTPSQYLYLISFLSISFRWKVYFLLLQYAGILLAVAYLIWSWSTVTTAIGTSGKLNDVFLQSIETVTVWLVR